MRVFASCRSSEHEAVHIGQCILPRRRGTGCEFCSGMRETSESSEIEIPPHTHTPRNHCLQPGKLNASGTENRTHLPYALLPDALHRKHLLPYSGKLHTERKAEETEAAAPRCSAGVRLRAAASRFCGCYCSARSL